MIASHPWQLMAVDVFKVPISLQANDYVLVAQGYFSKWLIPIPVLDQKAERIVWILKDQILL